MSRRTASSSWLPNTLSDNNRPVSAMASSGSPAAAHEKTRVAGIFQAIQDFKRAVADEVAGDGVLRAGNDQRLSDGGYPAVLLWQDSCLRCEIKPCRYNTISSQVGGKKGLRNSAFCPAPFLLR